MLLLFAESRLMSDAGLEGEELGGVAGFATWPIVTPCQIVQERSFIGCLKTYASHFMSPQISKRYDEVAKRETSDAKS